MSKIISRFLKYSELLQLSVFLGVLLFYFGYPIFTTSCCLVFECGSGVHVGVVLSEHSFCLLNFCCSLSKGESTAGLVVVGAQEMVKEADHVTT